MYKHRQTNSLDRRLFLAGSAAVLSALPGAARAQNAAVDESRILSARIADFVTKFDLKYAPPLAVERTRTAFIDTLGVMFAGSHTEPAEIVGKMVKAEGATPAVSVVGQVFRTSPQLAAFANGVASHALDFDLTYQQGQLVAPVIPALLPLAEKTGATQAELMAAFIVGFEVCSRLSRANPNHNAGGSWHGTGTIGTIGAAAACAKLLKLPARTIPDVLGISVSMAAGVNANYGTMTKPLHNGQAARNGIAAALLGERGFTASPVAIEDRGGFARTFARGLTWQPEAFDDLGQKFDLAERGFNPKRYPCGGVIHTAIDAALKIREGLAGHDEIIVVIKAGIANYAANRAKPEYPTNTEAAKFNLQYVVAQSFVNGAPKLETFDEPARNDPRVKRLAGLVTVSIDPEFADARENFPTRLSVELRGGLTIHQLVTHASGTAQFPMSAQQIEQKFLDCTAYTKIAKPKAVKILAALSRLGERSSLHDFWPLLQRA